MPRSPRPRKVRIHAKPEEDIAKAIRDNMGLLYLAAEQVGLDGSTVTERVQKSPYLQKVVAESREKRLDVAEKNLSRLVGQDNLGAICFILKTLGKSRGYQENSQLTVAADISQTFENIMKQLDKSLKPQQIEIESIENTNE